MIDRYIRNIQLEGFGAEGQQLLRKSSVLVVGAGALGSVSAMYLAASGIGRICVCDFDNVDITNLQRQLSYVEEDVGASKSETLAARLRAINSEIEVKSVCKFLRRDDLEELIAAYDLVLECTDNPDTKYMVTETAEAKGRPYVFGGVAQYSGQVLSWKPGWPGYSYFFPTKADGNNYMPCSVGGVFGPAPGIVASIQAAEAIKLITGIGTPLLGRLLLIDALNMSFRTIKS